jgi:outer membrane protein assembly factor BamB
MNNVPRQKLREIVAQYGRSICDNPQQCKGLLLDQCGEYKREVNILIAALEEHVVDDLMHISAGVPTELVLTRLSERLYDNRGMEKEAARWGVESWALALGMSVAQSSTAPTVLPQIVEVSTLPVLTPTSQEVTSSAHSSAQAFYEPVVGQEILVPKQRSISRRTVVLGLAGLAIAGAAGGSIFWRMQHNQELPDPSITSSGAMFGFDLQRTHFNPDEHVLSPTNVSHLVQYWTASTDGIIESAPTVVNGVVYIHSEDHKLYALSSTTGELLWSSFTAMKYTRSDDHYYDYSSPAVARGVVYIGSGEKDLYAFNAATGKLLWTATTGKAVLSSPAVSHGIVYVGSAADLYAFNAETGKTFWSVPASNFSFYAINASPAVANGMVYIGAFDYRVHAFDAITGNNTWSSVETPGTGVFTNHAPAVANGRVYVGTGDPALYAFDAATGKRVWSVTAGQGVFNSPPAIANGMAYIGSSDHNLYAFDASTGKMLWSASTGDAIVASPTVANGVVYVGSYDHKLYAFHLPS